MENIEETDDITSFSSPIKLIKKALSSFFVVLMIGVGFLINWIFAIVFAISCFSSTSFLGFVAGLVLMLVIFPVVYLFLAYSYGSSILIFEAYKEVGRPLIAKAFASALDTFLVDKPLENKVIDENKIIKEIEERQKHFLERSPDMIRSYFQVFFNAKDIIKIVTEQRQSGAEKEAVKQKAMKSLFEGIDLQLAEMLEPSLIPFYVAGAVNIVVLYFIF